ncbi:MAG: hypothetical protein QOJ43_488 [Gaiellaceae bacterium]|jgi:hypothetical protein|nr:hypothetical protein [Gaiellaceae bacterium]
MRKITPMSVLVFLVTSAAFLAKAKYGFFGGK